MVFKTCGSKKENRVIRLCIDFRNLRKTSLKDNHPLPKIDHIRNIRKEVVVSKNISFLDSFSGCN